VLSQNAQGSLSTSGDFNFTTAASSGLETLLQIQGNSSEISGLTNGSIVTPAIAPPGFTGTVVSNSGGSVNFTPAQTGSGVYFLNCCGTSNAYYKFTGSTIGNIFNVNQGQISFYLESRYSFAQRQATASAARYAFDVRDNNPSNHLFSFLTQTTSGYLVFSYIVGGNAIFYYVPQGTEDTLFGNGVLLEVTITWNGSTTSLYLNNTLVKTSAYTTPVPNWTAASNFDLGAFEYSIYGGYNSSDDVIAEFTVWLQ
jgi:hypothetical protein